jgi:hypothetical protein
MTQDQIIVNRIEFSDYGPERRVAIRADGEHDGTIPVPYLAWNRSEDGVLSLVLDQRFGLDLPGVTPAVAEAIVEFIANAIAVGGGYASIYYTDRKLSFRG